MAAPAAPPEELQHRASVDRPRLLEPGAQARSGCDGALSRARGCCRHGVGEGVALARPVLGLISCRAARPTVQVGVRVMTCAPVSRRAQRAKISAPIAM